MDVLRMPNILWVQPPRCSAKTIFLLRVRTKPAFCMHSNHLWVGLQIIRPSQLVATATIGAIDSGAIDRAIENENADTQSCYIQPARDYYTSFVLCLVRALNRLECVGALTRHALNCLAVVAADWLLAHSPPDWLERYGSRIEDYRFVTAA
jgi:hypothetical protein